MLHAALRNDGHFANVSAHTRTNGSSQDAPETRSSPGGCSGRPPSVGSPEAEQASRARTAALPTPTEQSADGEVLQDWWIDSSALPLTACRGLGQDRGSRRLPFAALRARAESPRS
jgi:hypothetical protein